MLCCPDDRYDLRPSAITGQRIESGSKHFESVLISSCCV